MTAGRGDTVCSRRAKEPGSEVLDDFLASANSYRDIRMSLKSRYHAFVAFSIEGLKDPIKLHAALFTAVFRMYNQNCKN